MDAQSRGRADEIDPADQWVLNPRTGHYELQLNDSAARERPKVGAPRRSSSAPAAPKAPSPGVPKPRRGDAPPGGRRGGRSRKGGGGGGGRRKKALLITSGTLAFLLVGGATAAYLYYDHLNGNLSVTDIAGAGTGGFKKDQAINILVIGTDKRSGAGNEGYGDKDSVGHADTTILFHIAKDRSNATALSIPRDLITNIPDCPTKQPDGTTKTVRGMKGTRFNTSLGQEGRDAGCTMRTVKELTGIEVDNFMMVDFNAVKTLSTAVGGVPVCLEKAVDDEDSKLKLSQGEHRLEGEQALAFVRTRHAFGNESDLDRIKTQQQFLGSMMREMKSKETLTSPKKFFSLAEAATKSLTVDQGLGSIDKLTDLAGELKDIDLKNITFTTLPVLDNPAEPANRKATVIVNQGLADPLLQMIRGDVSLTEVEKKEQAAKEAADADAKAKQDALLQGNRAPAGDVRVSVYNGGGPSGSASTTLKWLQDTKGMSKTSNQGNAPAKVGATQLEYAPNQADQARALADAMGLPATALKMGTTDAAAKTPMKLTLGPDFQKPGTPLAPPVPQELPKDVQQAQADKAICAK
ncbi:MULTISPECIES: LCP family protein [Streptomyces]|uniref:LytR family transcriptional regulator n=1 Tax=Streptomyces virginiae TaxID=1961 RepID=A0ABQ3NWQ5_STRVG|nr:MULTISPECIES: LCP family protein [Streptomyces]MBP2344454.1 LCP family protein required for cell wall assembly [Streptomyces virginiae]MCI4081843.1 LCP family protein [Streptomyces sp. MMS21 TC-5]QNE27057.1 LytR family transcriptional regulator [Streptomyces sp. INR7]RSS86894.1 LytR family transcriptional regulator [Streptomyces sp. WAC05950]GGP97821.1 LytR family transcriptional regulator [Streptomyces virginiae]